jgi:hypothetical protein
MYGIRVELWEIGDGDSKKIAEASRLNESISKELYEKVLLTLGPMVVKSGDCIGCCHYRTVKGYPTCVHPNPSIEVICFNNGHSKEAESISPFNVEIKEKEE